VKHVQHRRGYTIAEVMIAMTIFSMVMYGLYQFSLQTSHIIYDSVQRMDIDAGMRRFSQRLQTDMITAKAFYLYTSFHTTDRDSIDGSDRLAADTNGDFLLLVYAEPQPYSNSTVYITKLVGYFRKPVTGIDSWGPVYRFEVDYADETIVAASVDNVVETLIATQYYESTYPQVISSAKGLYGNRMYYNLKNQSVMVGLELYRGSAAKNTTELFHLTVSPR
jgi:prepilin-type N-terminal cleavage/methylation domain-containing protein